MRIYSGANDTVWAVARLGAERHQIAALAGQALVVWDEGAAEPVQQLPAATHGREHSDLIVSPDGSWLVGISEEDLRVWRHTPKGWRADSQDSRPGLCAARFTAAPATLTTVQVAEGKSAPVEFLVVTRLLGPRRSGSRQAVSRFDASPADLASAEDLHDSHYWAADLSADGRWLLLSAREKSIHVWDVSTGKPVGSVKLRGIPNEAAFSPDGSRFAVDGGTTVYIHDTRTLELIASWRVKHCYVPQLAWSPDGRWLARTDLTSAVHLFNVAGRARGRRAGRERPSRQVGRLLGRRIDLPRRGGQRVGGRLGHGRLTRLVLLAAIPGLRRLHPGLQRCHPCRGSRRPLPGVRRTAQGSPRWSPRNLGAGRRCAMR